MHSNGNKDLLVLGATGGTGQAIVRTAVERGYSVTCFVRDLQRAEHLFPGIRSQITFTQGDAFNADDIRRAMGSGLHAVISSLGIYQPLPGKNTLTTVTGNVLAAMRDAGVSRFVCVSSLGAGDSAGQGDLATRIIQKTALRFTLADKTLQEKTIMKAGLDWTLIRPTRLMNGNGPQHWTTWTGAEPDHPVTWEINRSDVGILTMDCLEDDSTIHQAITISGIP